MSMEPFVLSTKRNAPYLHLRLDWILDLCRTFPIEQLRETYILFFLFSGEE